MAAEGVTVRHQHRGRGGLPGRPADGRVRRRGAVRRRHQAPRPARWKGARLQGVHFAMEFLKGNTQRVLAGRSQEETRGGARCPTTRRHRRQGKDVIVIGGGDTGTDCVGTSIRQGCRSVVQFEIMDRPPEGRTTDQPLARVAQGAEDRLRPGGGHRPLRPRPAGVPCPDQAVRGRRAWPGEGAAHCPGGVGTGNGRTYPREIPGTEQVWPAQLVLSAMGFLGPEDSLLGQLGVVSGRALQCQGGPRRLRHQRGGRVRRRRHAPRPEPGGLGHQRGPRRRPRVRPAS